MPQNAFLTFALDTLAPLGELSARSMFGGHALYCDGMVFALVAGGTLYLKADGMNAPAFQERQLPAFQPFPDKPGTMSYYLAPPEIFEDRDAMLHWCGASLAASRRAAAKKARPKRAGR